MSKISEKAAYAFKQRRRFTSNNTEVSINGDGEVYMYLFGNNIAKTKNGDTWISDGGYKATVSTRSRLGMFINIRLCKGYFIINEKFKWDGSWLNISKLDNN